MKLTVVAVSQKPPDWAQTAWDSYTKRLPKDWSLDLKLVKPAARQMGKTAQQNMALEAQRIESGIKDAVGARVALDEHGSIKTTEQFLGLIQSNQRQHGGTIFIVGGPDGLDSEFKTKCHSKIQLSAMTLPHALVKVLLIEQIYRACSIASGHPYHRS